MERLKKLAAALLKKAMGTVVCWVRGHRRGKHVQSMDNGTTKSFQCPRCERIRTYKAKPA